MPYQERVKPTYHGYQELHVHTTASYRDGVNSVKEIFDQAEQQGRNAVAITDHGNMMRFFQGLKERTAREKKNLKKALEKQGVAEGEIEKVLKSMTQFDSLRNPSQKMMPYVEQYEDAFVEAANKSVQFVPGIETYFTPNGRVDDTCRYHLILYAKDWEGAKALFKIHNLAQLNKNAKGYARTCWEDLERIAGPGAPGHGHLICTSACIGGIIPQKILRPFMAQQKVNEVYQAMERDGVSFSPEDYAAAQEAVDEAKAELSYCKKAQTAYKNVQKSSVPWEKVEMAKAKVDAATEKLEAASGQLSFGENLSELKEQTALDKARKAYETVLARYTEQQQLLKDGPELPARTARAEKALADAKETLKSVSAKKTVYDRYQLKLSALEEGLPTAEEAYQDAKADALRFEQVFGKGNFFIELQEHGIDGEFVARPYLLRLIRETGIEPTVANDVHFATPNDYRKRALIASTRFNKPVTEMDTLQGSHEYYFKTNEQMAALCNEPEWRRGMENTSRIAEMCNVYYHKEMHLPEFDAHGAGFEKAIDYLRNFCLKMIPSKYPRGEQSDSEYNALMKQVRERLDYELGVIEKMGYASYIAIVQDFIFYGRRIGGPVAIGPGRGSAAGSIVCYLADITDVDPLKYNLIFERFLNPERVSMPEQYWAFGVNPMTQGCAA